MKIGIIGLGVVGGAVRQGFQKLGHTVPYYDLVHEDTSLDDVLGTSICYICVPTPSDEEGRCDTSIVRKVVAELCDANYTGIIAIKSTVEPGTTQSLIKEMQNPNICFVPEFLRERCAVSDFINNHDLCVIGCNTDEQYMLIMKSHGHYPKVFKRLTTTEAEFCKYFSNVYNATLITFANNFCELCDMMGVNYSNIKNVIINREHIHDSYLDCNDNFRGFAGVCLPKDTKAMANLAERIGTKGRFFQNILDENKKYRSTVMKGMRHE